MNKYIILPNNKLDGRVVSPHRIDVFEVLQGEHKGKFVCGADLLINAPELFRGKFTEIEIDESVFLPEFSVTKITVEYDNGKGELREVELSEKEIVLIREKIAEAERIEPIR